MHELKIPKERVACLIGKKGVTKKMIERRTKTRLVVSEEGDVEIEGDGYGEYVCETIVKAVGRGFNPNVALELLKDNYGLQIINVKDYSGDSKKKLIRLRSRLIGSKGKARKVVERLTRCHVSVYGKTVTILGELEYLPVATKGILKLLNGSEHGSTYAFIEREMGKVRG